jgi:hypothetical protein
MDKKLKPDVFWAINSNKYDTYMVSNTDRISFKCEDLYRFMEDYAQLRLSAVVGRIEQLKPNGSYYTECECGNLVHAREKNCKKCGL